MSNFLTYFACIQTNQKHIIVYTTKMSGEYSEVYVCLHAFRRYRTVPNLQKPPKLAASD